MLIVFGGRPGTGKTTISLLVAKRMNATYLRVDAIEQAIRNAAGGLAVGASGYAVAQAIADGNVGNGRIVVADCVNPVADSRRGWRGVAASRSVPLVDVELICSDIAEHRRRVTTRSTDIPGLVLPSWDAVMDLAYEPWDRPHLINDTARIAPSDAADAVSRAVAHDFKLERIRRRRKRSRVRENFC
ncbi:MAG: AAA family ATPase [Janthinobacterium lividum]